MPKKDSLKHKRELKQWIIKSDVGLIYLEASNRGLSSVSLEKLQSLVIKKLNLNDPTDAYLFQAEKEIHEYLAGRRKKFSVKLDLQGTDFQKKVWQELLKIPYGQAVSYQQIAERIENPKAVRAVGSANGKNPVCIIIPCHRVIAANGTLGGYSGGIAFKKRLLFLEKITYKA